MSISLVGNIREEESEGEEGVEHFIEEEVGVSVPGIPTDHKNHPAISDTLDDEVELIG